MGEAKFSGWRAGRMDAVSYDALDGDGPYKQVYVDNPEGRMHMGERLPDVVCRAFGVQGADCRDVATIIAAAPDMLAALKDMLQSFGSTDWQSVHDAARVEYARQVVAKAEGKQ